MKFLELQTVLNPLLWEPRGQLKPEVRGALLRISEDFEQTINIDFPILDRVITGSNVNYNYTKDSDLDLHIITDYTKIDCAEEADELFDALRHLYEHEHDIQIHGIPVTLYVEDVNTPGVSAGIYSIDKDRWIQRAKPIQLDTIDKKQVLEQTVMWHTIIDHVMAKQDYDLALSTQRLVRNYRKLGLKQPQAEFSTANLVYKQLRSDKTIDKLNDHVNSLHDKELSIQ